MLEGRWERQMCTPSKSIRKRYVCFDLIGQRSIDCYRIFRVSISSWMQHSHSEQLTAFQMSLTWSYWCKFSSYSEKMKQAGTGPSRRHIQGSKIAKRLPSVKYSFTVLENRNFLKKIFRKNYILKKMDRVARRGSLARAPGALKSHNAEKLKGWTLWGFSTSILSQNMKKLKKTKIFIFGKKSHNAEKKTERGGPFGIF